MSKHLKRDTQLQNGGLKIKEYKDKFFIPVIDRAPQSAKAVRNRAFHLATTEMFL